jgi:hypothetical protein
MALQYESSSFLPQTPGRPLHRKVAVGEFVKKQTEAGWVVAPFQEIRLIHTPLSAAYGA